MVCTIGCLYMVYRADRQTRSGMENLQIDRKSNPTSYFQHHNIDQSCVDGTTRVLVSLYQNHGIDDACRVILV